MSYWFWLLEDDFSILSILLLCDFIHFLCDLFIFSFRFFSLQYSSSSSSSSTISKLFIFLYQDCCNEFVFGKNSKFCFCLNCLENYKILLRILYFIMNIIFIFVYGKNSKFRFFFNCLEDLNIFVRVLYFIMKIVSLKLFTTIYIELHDCLLISTRSFTYINTIVYYIQYDHHDQTVIDHGQHDHLMYIISLHNRLSLHCVYYYYFLYFILLFNDSCMSTSTYFFLSLLNT